MTQGYRKRDRFKTAFFPVAKVAPVAKVCTQAKKPYLEVKEKLKFLRLLTASKQHVCNVVNHFPNVFNNLVDLFRVLQEFAQAKTLNLLFGGGCKFEH